jgi:hypothetical protein
MHSFFGLQRPGPGAARTAWPLQAKIGAVTQIQWVKMRFPRAKYSDYEFACGSGLTAWVHIQPIKINSEPKYGYGSETD